MGFLVFFIVAAVVGFALRLWLKKWWLSMLAPPFAYVTFLWVALNVGAVDGFPGWGYVWFVSLPLLLVAALVGAYAAGPLLKEKKV